MQHCQLTSSCCNGIQGGFTHGRGALLPITTRQLVPAAAAAEYCRQDTACEGLLLQQSAVQAAVGTPHLHAWHCWACEVLLQQALCC